MTTGRHKNLFLHLFLLCALAVTQPLYDLIGRTPEFLVAHRLEAIHLVGWVLLLSLGMPVMLYLLYRLLKTFSRTTARLYLRLIIATLAVLALLPVMKRLITFDGYLAVFAALLAGVVFTSLYFRREGLRMFLTWFSFAGVLFPLKFLFLTAAFELLRPAGEPPGYKNLVLEKTPPVIMVVFDEMPLLSLLDSNMEIDQGRFPHFAALVQDASWYRYHTTNSDSTLVSIPNLMSGNLPFGRDKGLPSFKKFPNNLLSLLQKQYTISATEHGTRLCPDTVCDPKPAYFKLMFTDSAVILGQLWLPFELSQHLPSTNNDWLGFMGEKVEVTKDLNNFRAFQKTINWRTRVVQFDEFMAGITPEHAKLYYLHSMFPHASWRHLPDGRLMTAGTDGKVVGIGPNDPKLNYKHIWYESDSAARVSHQRHILQVGYVDTLIGRLVQRLKELGIWEESLLVITSDHGVSFRAGYSRRNVHGDNLPEIAGVPLLIKYPGNQPSGISDLNAQSMDILPTILDVVGASGWDKFDGQSLLNNNRDDSREKFIYSEESEIGSIDFKNYRQALLDRARSSARQFGEGDFASLYRAGDELELNGAPVSQFEHPVLPAPGVRYKHYDFIRTAHRGGPLVQMVVHGNFDAPFEDNPSGRVAVSVNGVIRAVTEPFSFPGQDNGFQVIVPPEAFNGDSTEVRTWFVIGEAEKTVLLEAPGLETESYSLVRNDDQGWSMLIGDETIRIEKGVVPGWVTVAPGLSSGNFQVAGWAADLKAAVPAAKILTFIDGEYYYGLKPDRNSESAANRFRIPGIEQSGFRIPVSVPDGKSPADLQVRIFALSHAGEISELHYPTNRKNWVFRQNPRIPGPAVKPYQ